LPLMALFIMIFGKSREKYKNGNDNAVIINSII